MTDTKRSPVRGVTLLLVLALFALAGVVYALIRITSPDTGGDATDLPSESIATAPPPAGTTDPGRTPAAPTSIDPTTAPGTGTDAPVSSSSTTSTVAERTWELPSAWSGVAQITVGVLGDCATETPAVYADTPADIALVPLSPTGPVAVPVTDLDTAAALSLGINATSLPSLAVYSAIRDDDDLLRRYWQLDFTSGAERVEFVGEVIDDSALGPNPNLVVDAETSLLPCEAAGTVALPRIFATGSTISGWFNADSAHIEIEATTTDGKRSVAITVEAERRD